MFSYIVVNYNIGNKLRRESISRKVDSNNFSGAAAELQNEITKHSASYSYTYNNKKDKYGEKIVMDHVLGHLNGIIANGDHEIDFSVSPSQEPIRIHFSDRIKTFAKYNPKS